MHTVVPQLMAARAFMGMALGFHIVFALLGVGLPFMVSFFEFLGVYRHDDDYRRTARRMTFAMSVLFVTGALSGTVMSFLFSLLWPHFAALANTLVGLPFVMEGFAFMVEAVFLGIYVYSWDRLSPWKHWLCSIPLALGSFTSAFLITIVNSFMNDPQGFQLINGVATNIQPFAVMFNHATWYEVSHSILAYYLTTAAGLATLSAIFLLRPSIRRDHARSRYYKKITVTMAGMMLVLATLVVLAGDLSGKYIAQYEPIKFAASESMFQTTADAPLKLGGFINNDQVHYAISIPGVLSWLAFDDTHAVVRGLEAFDPSEWPPLFIHYFLDIMVLIGFYLFLIPLVFLLLYMFKRSYAFSHAMILWLVWSGPLAFVSVEMGWMLTEIGRQPYIIRGIMTTAQAVTESQAVITFVWIFPVIYAVLFLVTVGILYQHYRKPMDLVSVEHEV